MIDFGKIFKQVLLLIICFGSFCGNYTHATNDSIEPIVTLFLDQKATEIYIAYLESTKKKKLKKNEIDSIKSIIRSTYFYSKSFNGLTDDFIFISVMFSLLGQHYSRLYVYDKRIKAFVDDISVDFFNKILRSVNEDISLNAYDKARLYNKLNYDIEMFVYHHSGKIIWEYKFPFTFSKVWRVYPLYAKRFPMNPNLEYFTYLRGKSSLGKNKSIRRYTDSSDEMIFYLPYFNYPAYLELPPPNSKKKESVTLQYFILMKTVYC
ncbi:MAG: hypothetical protein JJU02_14130 [Cryomorphaceae bacterium]|nr:hypothetical protein [Cryomorphaceae bacterium]